MRGTLYYFLIDSYKQSVIDRISHKHAIDNCSNLFAIVTEMRSS